jgi:hypothetical protein
MLPFELEEIWGSKDQLRFNLAAFFFEPAAVLSFFFAGALLELEGSLAVDSGSVSYSETESLEIVAIVIK